MITIQELLLNRGLPVDARVKMVRHIDSNLDLRTMYSSHRDLFLRYQSTQANDIFKDYEYIVSFLGEDNSTARFIGVFRLVGKSVGEVFNDFGDGIVSCSNFTYDFEEVPGFEDLSERAVVKWPAPRSWHQRFDNLKEVIELSPGLHYQSFRDYLDIILSFPELSQIIHNNYSDWKVALSAVKGIYLITDISTGRLYVGSAYGDNGIWGRWSEYVKTGGHGGNKTLRALVDTDPCYAINNFRFSILMVMNKSVTPAEAIRKEALFKRKLGSNSFGLNEN